MSDDDKKTDDDVVQYMLQFTPECTNIVLHVSCAKTIEPMEYIQCLVAFVNEYEKNPNQLFSDDDAELLMPN